MKERNSFRGAFGFVMAAAASAVGLGNIWRFPYFAAKDGGGIFLLVYLILLVTFGYVLLTTELSIGRKTKQGPLTAYSQVKYRWRHLGILSCLIPMIIMPYYCVIGGWVLKYCFVYIKGDVAAAADDGYFSSFISGTTEPIVLTVIFLLACMFIIFKGIQDGVEKSAKILMPILIVLVVFIAIFALTISHTDASGVTRTGLDGLKVLVIPNISDLTFTDFIWIVIDAFGQLFFSLSIAMGIMVAYGSYVDDRTNLSKSANQIMIFDTGIAFLAGVMIIPTVYAFSGYDGLSSSGPGLMFVSLPKIFAEMGFMGRYIGIIFFIMVLFAALTSAVSIMEAIVTSFIDYFNISRKKATIIEGIIAIIAAVCVCLGYNIMYFEFTLPSGTTGQLLDIFDYISNNLLMPSLAILTCILIGWVVKPKWAISEITKNGERFRMKITYRIIIRYIAPVLLLILLLESLGVI